MQRYILLLIDVDKRELTIHRLAETPAPCQVSSVEVIPFEEGARILKRAIFDESAADWRARNAVEWREVFGLPLNKPVCPALLSDLSAKASTDAERAAIRKAEIEYEGGA